MTRQKAQLLAVQLRKNYGLALLNIRPVFKCQQTENMKLSTLSKPFLQHVLVGVGLQLCHSAWGSPLENVSGLKTLSTILLKAAGSETISYATCSQKAIDSTGIVSQRKFNLMARDSRLHRRCGGHFFWSIFQQSGCLLGSCFGVPAQAYLGSQPLGRAKPSHDSAER